MQPIYRNLTRYDEATKAYEKFASEDPMNPERQILLFNAYAREYDYLKQQQVGTQMQLMMLAKLESFFQIWRQSKTGMAWLRRVKAVKAFVIMCVRSAEASSKIDK